MTQFWVETSWLLPCYGLLGALASLPWSAGLIRRTGPRPAAYINIFMTLVASIHGLLAFQGIWNQGSKELMYNWFSFADLQLNLSL
jgi:NAD(P)H-quinone oxidoreductase subunit 5